MKVTTDKPNLDLLRTIAVSFVVIAHVLTAKGIDHWGGLFILNIAPFGVFLFFVHTSLVLMWSLERRPNTLDFYVRRAFRIYPLAIFTILIAAATHAPVSEIGGGSFHAAAVINFRAILFNCMLLNGLTPYTPLLHGVTWSLPPEIFMYLLLPALFAYASFTRKIWPLLVLWALVARMDQQLFHTQTGNFFAVLIPDFLAGIIAYVGFMRRRPTLPAWTLLPFLAILLFSFMTVHLFRFDWYCCLALALLLPSFKQFRAGRFTRLMHTIATYSYSVYLLHTFFIVLGIYLLPSKPLVVQLAVIFLPLIPSVYLTYHFIEKPMIGLGARVAARLAHERGLPSPQTLESLEPAP